jgi:hypothetical protein
LLDGCARIVPPIGRADTMSCCRMLGSSVAQVSDRTKHRSAFHAVAPPQQRTSVRAIAALRHKKRTRVTACADDSTYCCGARTQNDEERAARTSLARSAASSSSSLSEL